MPPESLEMEPLTEKLLRKSMDDSFSDTDPGSEEDDIMVHSGDRDGPSMEDRELLDEEDEREKLLIKKRGKVIIGSSRNGIKKIGSRHSRRKSTENYMENGTLNKVMGKRLKAQRRRCSPKRIFCCHVIVLGTVLLGIIIALVVRVFSRPLPPRRPNSKVVTMSNGTHTFQPTVLIVSLDGFRPNYIDRGLTPNLHQLSETGVAPEYMKPCFPSVTFPNHYSIVTGLYPESHGVIANEYYDPVLDQQFDIGSGATSLQSYWWEGTSGGLVEPIWVTAEKQGVITATHMWPGSEAVIQGIEPTHVDKFNAAEDLSNKVHRVMGWLDLPDEERPGFIATYVPTIDSVGHHDGPDSLALNISLTDVDSMIGAIMDGLEQRNLTDIVNLIVVSDHGMAQTSRDRIIYLDEMIDLNTIPHIDAWPLKGIRPAESENITALYDHLKSLSVDQPWNVYLRDVDMPAKWHFSATYRIAPIYIIPDPEWVIVNSKEEFDPDEDEIYYPQGVHGYDNDSPLMRALFVGRGPALRYNYPVRPFENIEVYGIMTNILGIDGIENNCTFMKGRLQRLPASSSNNMLPSPTTDGDLPTDTGIPEMTQEDWDQIEGDLAEAEAENRPLTWKEYLELKAEQMKEELDDWWDWIKHGGADDGPDEYDEEGAY